MDAINKTLQRVATRIGAQEYYEAHQAVRTVVARYVRQKKWSDAVDTLYSSALLLADANQVGSVCDLVQYLLTVYASGSIPVDSISKGRLAQVVLKIPVKETALKHIARQATQWAKNDADIHNLFGTIFANAGEYHEAESNLLVGTRDSAVTLAEMHRRWWKADAPERLPFYISRGVFGYLSVCDMRNVHTYLETALPYAASDLNEEPTEQGQFKVFPNYPLINFLQMLVAACQSRARSLYLGLQEEYSPKQYEPWQNPLLFIEESYFDIVPQRQFNIMDLMGGLLNG